MKGRRPGDPEQRVVTSAHQEHRNPDPVAGAQRNRELPGQLGRLGPLEYVLFGLVVVAIAITIAMAVVDPSG